MQLQPDNPVWDALNSHQARFNAGTGKLRFFSSDVSPFIGMQHWDEEDIARLKDQLPDDRTFSVMINRQVQLPAGFEIVFNCTLFQMVCHRLPAMVSPAELIRPLGYDDVPQMLELTAKTKPGPFLKRTIEMGHYFGIFDNMQLVAMAGERLRLDGFTEISAICTAPEHLGKGYASLLTTHVAKSVFASGNIPFLHVKTDNTRAIEVYRRAGFEIRTEVFFAIFRRR
jgi:ribosomal protein S18 acetylase RimI-like enzyme